MTNQEFGTAYESGYKTTVRFLISRGVSRDCARETAQAAWARGWEKRSQLRNSKRVTTWINTIALNVYRTELKRDRFLAELPEMASPRRANVALMDLARVLKACKKHDRMVLENHYLDGYAVREIALANGWSETAVRIRLLRARRAVAKQLAA